jgi:hypothetical protein
MKRILLIIFAALAFVGCEDIQDNSPAIQGEVNGQFFKALEARGQINDNGTFTLQGINEDEKIILNLSSAQPGEYPLGVGEPNSALFENADGVVYGTSPLGEGKIIISDHCASCGHLSGRFNFMGINPGVDTIYFDKGYFFEVSYLAGGIDDETSDGFMRADINGEPFYTEVVAAEEVNGIIIVNGFVDTKNITIKVPANAASGNYPVGTPGFSASYTENDIVEVATSGTITVNFINQDLRRGKIFFNFNTENKVITSGDTEIQY